MKNIKDLQAEKMSIYNDMATLLEAEKESGLSKEAQAKFDQMDADFEAINRKIEVLNKLKDLENENILNNGQSIKEKPELDYSNAFKKYFRNKAVSADEIEMLHNGFNPQMVAEQSAITGADGAFMIPTGWVMDVIRTMKYYGPNLDACGVIETNTGRNIPYPTSDDTGNAGYLLDENVSSETAAVKVPFGTKPLDAYVYTSGMIQVPLALIEDEGVNFEGLLADTLGERIGRALNTATTNGTGVSQPNGFITAATVGKTAASGTAITAAEIMDLEHSVDFSYRKQNKTAFQLNDLILKEIKKLSIGANDDRPLWIPSIRDGEPDTLLGYKYHINNDMDSALAVNNKIIAFGDFGRHKIRLVKGMSLQRLNERYAEKRQIGWVSFVRFDSELMDTSAIKVLQMAAV